MTEPHIMTVEDRLVYQRRIAAMPKYYVGQQVIDDGVDAVHDFAMAQLETMWSDAALRRVQSLMWSHGIKFATMDGGDSPGSTDYIRINCGKNDPTLFTEGDDEWSWVVCVYWAEGPLARDEYTPGDIAIQAWRETPDGDVDSHLAHVLFPLGLHPTDDTVLDACEAIVEYIYANAIPHESAIH